MVGDGEEDVKMNLPCVGSELREGSGLLTPEPSGINMSQRLSQTPNNRGINVHSKMDIYSCMN